MFWACWSKVCVQLHFLSVLNCSFYLSLKPSPSSHSSANLKPVPALCFRVRSVKLSRQCVRAKVNDHKSSKPTPGFNLLLKRHHRLFANTVLQVSIIFYSELHHVRYWLARFNLVPFQKLQLGVIICATQYRVWFLNMTKDESKSHKTLVSIKRNNG